MSLWGSRVWPWVVMSRGNSSLRSPAWQLQQCHVRACMRTKANGLAPRSGSRIQLRMHVRGRLQLGPGPGTTTLINWPPETDSMGRKHDFRP